MNAVGTAVAERGAGVDDPADGHEPEPKSDDQSAGAGLRKPEGCVIYTTVELVIGETQGLIFHRETDARTGFKELSIQRTE